MLEINIKIKSYEFCIELRIWNKHLILKYLKYIETNIAYYLQTEIYDDYQ